MKVELNGDWENDVIVSCVGFSVVFLGEIEMKPSRTRERSRAECHGKSLCRMHECNNYLSSRWEMFSLWMRRMSLPLLPGNPKQAA